MSERYCRDCKHLSGLIYADCLHPSSPRDMVHAHPAKASWMRSTKGMCGNNAKLFEDKSEPPKRRSIWQKLIGN
jgi:hypothetical protein